MRPAFVAAALLGLSIPVRSPAMRATDVRAPDALAFGVTAGLSVEKRFTLEHALSVLKVQLAGQEAGPLSQQGLEVNSKLELGVLDTYRRIEGGRPLELQRLFQTGRLHVDLATTDPTGAKTPDSADAETPLQKKSAVFTWVPEEKTYGRYYDDVETLEEYLAELSEDLDLRALLPDHAVSAGGTWTIEPARLVDVFAPGGDIPYAWVKGGGGTFSHVLTAGVGGPLHDVFGGTAKGKVEAHWKETREAEGARLAVVELTIAVETQADHSGTPGAAASAEEPADARTVEHSGVHWKFEGTGTLLWNLGAGRFESLELVGREEVSSDLTLEIGLEKSRQVLTMQGSLKVGAVAKSK
jgi:hypothetical protein